MTKKILLVVIGLLGVQLSAGLACGQQWGHLSARFVFDGTPPKPKPTLVTKDAAFCGKFKLTDDSLVVNPKNKGIANVVVFLRDTKKPAIHPDYPQVTQVVLGGNLKKDDKTGENSLKLTLESLVEKYKKYNLTAADFLQVNITGKAPSPLTGEEFKKLTPKDKITIPPLFEKKVSLNNVNCRFVPRIGLLQTYQTLVLGNNDLVGHNTNIACFANGGVNPLIPAGAQVEQKFTIDERYPSPTSCSIHPWMNAFLMIRSNPYFAASDADGKIHIKNIPAGTWEFYFWQEKSGHVRSVTVGGKKTEWKRGRVDLKIPAGKTLDLGDVVVDKKLFQDE